VQVTRGFHRNAGILAATRVSENCLC
jgi:hypothetical protein